MKLTISQIRKAEPRNKPYKLYDGGGLYIEITPAGGRYWRLKYRFAGKEKKLCIGTFPEISLSQARDERYQAKSLLSNQIDPSILKQKNKRQLAKSSNNTFRVVAEEWLAHNRDEWSERHRFTVESRLLNNVYPFIGNCPITDLDTQDILYILRKIEKRSALEVARRTKGICSQIFRFGVQTNRCKYDPTTNLRGALKSHKSKHFPALEFSELPELMSAIQVNDAKLKRQTIRAILFSLLTFTRPGELRHARKEDIDYDTALWRIPAEFMKMDRDHIVPLSHQAIEILKEQEQEISKINTPWVFPSHIRPRNPISNGTVNVAVKRLGFEGRMTAHGFRALARTSIREQLDYPPDVIEAQLAHKPSGSLGAAYDRAKFLKQRKVMMQDWADLITSISPISKTSDS